MEVVSGSNKEEGEISREEEENGNNTVVEVISLAGVVNGSSKEEVVS